MKQLIIYTNTNGGVAVCAPTGEISIYAVQQKDVPSGVESFIVDADQMPWVDSDFFDAWEQTNGVVRVNLSKAKDVAKERLRFERQPLLEALDVQFQRALETGASTAEVVAEKQRLRDLPALADSCTSLDQLRALKAAA